MAMELIKEHHHYKRELIQPTDRVAKCERYVIDLLLTSSLPDSERDSSIAFELKHHHGATQMGRILARKRGLPLDVCTVGMLLHDIHVIIHGRYKGHAHLGAPIAVQIVSEIGGFSSDEVDQIRRIVYHHSDKHVWSDDPFQEFGKDADILECFLYPNPLGDYLLHKPLYVLSHYLRRAKLVWQELGIPEDPGFDLLRNYSPSWFEPLTASNPESLQAFLSVLLALSGFDKKDGVYPPAFCLVADDTQLVFYTNRDNWYEYIGRLRSTPHIGYSQGVESLREVLKLPLTKDPEVEKIPRLLSEVQGGLVSEALTKQAGQLLSTASEKQCAFVFWPAADVYEIVDGERMSARLKEFGIVDT